MQKEAAIKKVSLKEIIRRFEIYIEEVTLHEPNYSIGLLDFYIEENYYAFSRVKVGAVNQL